MIQFDLAPPLLSLKGDLDVSTLTSLWLMKDQLAAVERINVAELGRVDSSGLALLTCFCTQQNIKLINLTPQLELLVDLYDLDNVVL